MNLYKYIHVLADGKSVPIGKEYKTPFVWADKAPDEDYIQLEGEELAAKAIERHAKLYDTRRLEGKKYADVMNARLIVLGDTLLSLGITAEIEKVIRTKIRRITEPARVQVSSGLWKSAQDEANDMEVDGELKLLVDEMGLGSLINQEKLILDVRKKIDETVEKLY